jgi:hypothetical protein
MALTSNGIRSSANNCHYSRSIIQRLLRPQPLHSTANRRAVQVHAAAAAVNNGADLGATALPNKGKATTQETILTPRFYTTDFDEVTHQLDCK